MDIGRSLSFAFEDKKWVEKILIGGIVVFIPIIGWLLVYGYMVELVRNVRRDEETLLPAWDGWGEKIALGLKLFVVTLIWALPLIILMVPSSILTAVSEDAGGFLAICFSCVAFLYAIVFSLALPGITIKFAETGRISSGLEFSNILAFTRENLGEVIIAMIVIWLVSMAAGIVGALLCGIGLLFTMFWATLVQGFLYGQIGRDKTSTSLDTVDASYDLSPDDVMPGVGELADETQAGAEEAVSEVTDVADSTVDASTDVLDDGNEEEES